MFEIHAAGSCLALGGGGRYDSLLGRFGRELPAVGCPWIASPSSSPEAKRLVYGKVGKRIWRKGGTSGNVLKVISIAADCDLDCLLLKVEPAGPACHTGKRSCFFEALWGEPDESDLGDVLGLLLRAIRERHRSRPEGSYTAELFARGTDRIAQKVGEEATEVVIAAAREDRSALAEESADLLYHLLVLWKSLGLEAGEVAEALKRRMP